jgi:preprotein translocase subunit SecD
MPHSTLETGLTRRRVLAVTGTVLGAGVAGCLDDDGTGDQAGGAEATLLGIPVGTHVEGIDVDTGIADRLWTETALDFHEVSVTPDAGIVEFYTDLSHEAARDALETVGVDTTDATVNAGVTAGTRDEMRETIEQRLDVDVSTTDHDGQPAIRFVGADAEASTVREELSARPVQIVISYPDSETGDRVRETILASGDFQEIDAAAQGSGDQSPHVPVELTDEAAERFVDVMTDRGFTTKGVNYCSLDASADDEPEPDDYCILTRIDGADQYSASMSHGLADVIENGAFQDSPRFVLTTQDFSRAEQLQATLQEANESGVLPTVLEYESPE